MEPASPAPTSDPSAPAPVSASAPASAPAPGPGSAPAPGPGSAPAPGLASAPASAPASPAAEGTPVRDGIASAGDRIASVEGDGAVEKDRAVEGDGAPRLSGREVRSPRDMMMSLVVLIVPIALLLIFYRVVLSGDAPVTIDPSPTIQEAQQAKLFPIAVPQGLGDRWHPASATWTRQADGATLRIGYVDPGKNPVQLVESNVAAVTLLPAELSDKAKPLTTFRAPNGVWRLYAGRPGEQALVLAEADRTIILVGKTGEKNLEQLATALS